MTRDPTGIAERSWWPPSPRAAAGLAGAAAIGVVGILVASLLLRPEVAPTATPSGTASPTVSPATPPGSPPSAVEASRYPGGIPMSFDGEAVYLGLGATLHAEATTDATPFLVGGWFEYRSEWECSGGIGPRASIPPALHTRCGGRAGAGSSAPWGWTWSGGTLRVAWNGHSLPGRLGPSIVRVHTHDPSAAECSPQVRAECESILVVDDVLWTGDAWTAASPLSVAEAVRRLEAVEILNETRKSDNSAFAVYKFLSVTTRPQTCAEPWPYEVFDVHGDPRFGLLAVFPTEAARVTAQAELDPSAQGCPTDPRIVRPGAPVWVGYANVLGLVYGSVAADGARKALSIPSSQHVYTRIPYPPSTLDESYRAMLDFLAARESGSGAEPLVQLGWQADPDATAADTKRRYEADALRFSIGLSQTVTEGDVGVAWQFLSDNAAPGTPRLFVVDHPQSTDPALRQEVFVSYRTKLPSNSGWVVFLVEAAPWPTPS